MSEIRTDRLRVVEDDGKFWAMDWVPGPFGNTTIDRYHLAFAKRRDAEAFVRAAKRALQS